MHTAPFRRNVAGNGEDMRTLHGEHTVALLREGYAFLPNRRAALGVSDFRTHLLGRPAVCVYGPQAAERFYDDDLFVRRGAVPGFVQHTLTGPGAVHTLDGSTHRRRKELFLAVKDPQAVRDLVDRVAAEWDAAVDRWQAQDRVVLFDEAAEVLLRGVCGWAGVPQDETARVTSGDMVAMVDGFGTVGPRHWRARRARRRCERRLQRPIERVRAGVGHPPDSSMLHRVGNHRDEDGTQLDSRTAAVEMLNVLRPTVAITWLVAFAAHALHRWPGHRARLADADDAYAEAFAHEVRRFYPFAPFMGATARHDVPWDEDVIGTGTLVLLDLFGQNHDARRWPEPFTFRPERFVGHPPGLFDLVPQGGGEAATGHRCPGEDIVVEVLKELLPRLARMTYRVPPQDLTISLSRVPAKPRSGVVLSGVHA